MNKTIGILGGMGPFATLDLFQKILDNTPAEVDQDHLKIFIYNNPKIPPRMQLPHQFNSPLPELIQSATILQEAGADFLIMPCHTAHIWYEEVVKHLSIPFYSIIHNTVKSTDQLYGDKENKKLLLLATETTIQSELYQREFKNSSFTLVVPHSEQQKIVDEAIKAVKSGKINPNDASINKLNQLINQYSEEGISLLLGCCTEIPIMYPFLQTEMKMVDPTLLLAKLAIAKAMEGIGLQQASNY